MGADSTVAFLADEHPAKAITVAIAIAVNFI
jgi:hypothetical protein